MKKAGMTNVTEIELWRLQSGYDMDGCRNPPGAGFMLKCYQYAAKLKGIHPGKFRFRGKVPKTAPIVLCGASAPAFGKQALDWVNRSLGLSLELKEVPNPRDFTPDPLKPVPPGRTPCNLERHRLQSDFLSELRVAENRPVPSVHADDDFPRSLRRRSSIKNGVAACV